MKVIFGSNGIGKTSVLEAIDLGVRAVISARTKVFREERHCDWVYTRGGNGNLSIAFETEGGSFSVTATPPSNFTPSESNLLGKGSWKVNVVPSKSPRLAEAVLPVSSVAFLHLDAKTLAKPWYSDVVVPRVEYDGEGLASVLAYMALNDPETFQALLNHMRKLIPHLRQIRFQKMPIKRTSTEYVDINGETAEREKFVILLGEAMLFDFDNAKNVSAQTVSQGTLILLGLMTVLLSPTRPKVILMDDIEHGLHPLAQKSLLDVLVQVMKTFPELQIIASAHSPYLLDQLKPEQIRLLTLDQHGFSVCGRLQDHPEFDKWKDEMAPGELWSLFGEKWIAERRSAK